MRVQSFMTTYIIINACRQKQVYNVIALRPILLMHYGPDFFYGRVGGSLCGKAPDE